MRACAFLADRPVGPVWGGIQISTAVLDAGPVALMQALGGYRGSRGAQELSCLNQTRAQPAGQRCERLKPRPREQCFCACCVGLQQKFMDQLGTSGGITFQGLCPGLAASARRTAAAEEGETPEACAPWESPREDSLQVQPDLPVSLALFLFDTQLF